MADSVHASKMARSVSRRCAAFPEKSQYGKCRSTESRVIHGIMARHGAKKCRPHEDPTKNGQNGAREKGGYLARATNLNYFHFCPYHLRPLRAGYTPLCTFGSTHGQTDQHHCKGKGELCCWAQGVRCRYSHTKGRPSLP